MLWVTRVDDRIGQCSGFELLYVLRHFGIGLVVKLEPDRIVPEASQLSGLK